MTRGSIVCVRSFFANGMDCRVKPGNDEHELLLMLMPYAPITRRGSQNPWIRPASISSRLNRRASAPPAHR